LADKAQVRIDLGWLFFILATLFFGLTSLCHPYTRDPGTFAAAAQSLAAGGVPYINFWDVKPPGIFFLFYIARVMFGEGMIAIRIFDLLWQASTGIVVGCIARRMTGSKNAGWLASAIYLMTYYTVGACHTLQPDSFLNLPLAAAVLICLRAYDGRSISWLPWTLAGLILGAGFLIKYNVALAAPVLGVLALALGCRLAKESGQSVLGIAGIRKILQAAFFLTAGFFVALVLCGIYLAVNGALTEFLVTSLELNPQYTAISFQDGGIAGVLSTWLAMTFGDFFPPMRMYAILIGFSVLAIIWLGLRGDLKRAGWLVIASWFFLMLIAVFIQGKNFTYHHHPIAPAGAVLCAMFVVMVGEIGLPRKVDRLLAVGTAVALLIVLWPWAVRQADGPGAWLFRGATLRQVYSMYVCADLDIEMALKTADYIRDHTEPEDMVFIFGHEAMLYPLSGRLCASRFIYHVPVMAVWASSEYVEIAREELAEAKPRIIGLVANDALPHMTGIAADSIHVAAELAWFKEILRHYRPAAQIGDYFLFIRAD